MCARGLTPSAGDIVEIFKEMGQHIAAETESLVRSVGSSLSSVFRASACRGIDQHHVLSSARPPSFDRRLDSMEVNDVLETERLVLRAPTESDVTVLNRLQRDPQMMRYMSDGHVYDLEESQRWLERRIAIRSERGFGIWCAELKSNDTVIGWFDLALPEWFPELLPTPEIGWFIDRRQWGKGLATEGAGATLRAAIDQRGFDRIIAICRAENLASARVMENIGMSFVEDRMHPVLGHPLKIYATNAQL
jgi:RimJ/RimL family protein N-acetyltransferase